MTASLGWRTHSGWAVLVAVGGSVAAPTVLSRQRVDLLTPPLPTQPYHAAVDDKLTLEAAAALVRKVEEAAASRAAAATEAAIADLAKAGHQVDAVGLVAGERRLPSDLAKILSAHPLLHAAEGDLYEQAVIEGATRVGLSVSTAPAKGTFEHAAIALGVTADALAAALAVAGKAAGPPWQKDHREAAASALAARAGAARLG